VNKLTAFDLFSGCGGLSLGLKAAGFDVRWANEIDGDAAETFVNSAPEVRMANIDANELLRRIEDREPGLPLKGEVDLLAGGPPCQGFSGYNRYRSPDDPRNSLIETFLAFVEVLEPRFILIENVPGMLQMNQGAVPNLITDILDSIGYSSHLGILQAGHFGVAQNRWRVFILASQRGLQLPCFPEPAYAFPRTIVFGARQFRDHIIKGPTEASEDLFQNIKPGVTVGDAIDDLPAIGNGGGEREMAYQKPAASEFQRSMRQGSILLLDHIAQKQGGIMYERVKAVPKKPGAGWLDLPDHLKPKNLLKHGDNRYPNRFGRLWWDGIFNTIVTRAYPYWGRFIHPTQNRVISVRECARAQGIHDSVRFSGNLYSMYKQVGNAVPPPLAEAIARAIVKAADESGV